MRKFIKITECNGNVILINVDRIEHITLGTKGTDTYIKLLANNSGKENYFFIKETVEDVWNMMDDEQIISMDVIK